MRKTGFAALACIVLLITHGYLSSADESKGPMMVLEEREFDCGKVLEGKTIEHTFKVLNRGDQTLKIIAVKPG